MLAKTPLAPGLAAAPLLIASLLAACAAWAASESPPAQPATIPQISAWIGSEGEPNPATWRHAAHFSIDNEFQPGRNVSAPVATDVYVGYTDTALWLRFVAHDPEPAEILAKYRRHDRFGNDQDFVGVIFSPFNSTQTAYEFFCSAAGTELDAFRQQGREYGSYDAIWYCDARVTENGYTVVMRIPFGSLKFPQSGEPQRWRIVLFRNWPRSVHHKMIQFRFNYNSSCLLCQAQTVETATPIRARGANIQLIPSVTVSRTDERATPSSSLENGSPQLEASLDARWAIRPNLVWSATLNPNFSQVAPDVLKSTVNRRFALFFPENRPFFRRGTWVFNTPGFDFGVSGGGRLVDTRQIANPDWATKTVGRIGRHALGALVANDAITNILVPGRLASDLKSFDFSTRDALLRYRYDFAGSSTIGVLATGRRGGGYDNGVIAIDGQWQINPSNSVTLQTATSTTRYPADVAALFGIEPGRVTGNAWAIEYDLTRRNFVVDVSAGQVASGFRADLGFMPQVGYRGASARFEYNWYAHTAWWNNGGFGATYGFAQATGEGPVLQRTAQVYTFVHALKQTHILFYIRHQDQFFGGQTFGLQQYELITSVRPLPWLELDLNMTAGDGVDFVGVRKGKLLSISSSLSLAPGRHLKIELVTDFERLNLPGGRLYTTNLYDLRVAWYFNSRMFVRAIAQAQDIRRNTALYPPGTSSQTRTLATQWLFGYVINPWTSFFIGYSNGYLGTRGSGLAEQRRSLFVKLSYAWQP